MVVWTSGIHPQGAKFVYGPDRYRKGTVGVKNVFCFSMKDNLIPLKNQTHYAHYDETGPLELQAVELEQKK